MVISNSLIMNLYIFLQKYIQGTRVKVSKSFKAFFEDIYLLPFYKNKIS